MAQLDRNLMEQLMFGTGRVRRFTQDSPVLPDVWLEYAKGPGDEAERLTSPTDSSDPCPAVKLLITPFRENYAGDIRRELRERLEAERKTPEWREFKHDPERLSRVVYNQSTVAATLYFEDLIRAVLPMTAWWEQLDRLWDIDSIQADAARENVAIAVQDPEHPPLLPTGEKEGEERRPPPALLWMIRIAGALALVHRGKPLPEGFLGPKGVAGATTADWRGLVDAVADLIRNARPGSRKARIFSVSLNREATPTVSRSTLAIKADAARRLFEISCRELAWAVIDSGIDARHPAFRRRTKDGPLKSAFEDEDGAVANGTRIVETYDFTQIDLLLDPDTSEQPEHLKARMAGRSEAEAADLVRQLETLNEALSSGRSVDWKLVAPLLRIPQDEGEAKYGAPGNDHGTHVAGILASDWRRAESDALEEDLIGVCPDLRLYDFRVLNADGKGDEFAVMAALQFIRHLNSTNDYMAVHGVNLSLSIPHDISNYACGRTPVCEECERVVNSGVVVVAAAGNQGYRKYTTAEGMTSEAYNSISITDPGNADLVITVGATHRYRPHTYGVSYFSSRGPTGDGRIKPDLVAPGEKITSPLPNELFGLKDGTSMAAPHVSGVAALLMARHNELVGHPGRIKQILRDTATDLGRERYFQGAGMLDALRALQSV
ncbi:MAG TPA: S8 family serine peptidase [Thermoanaerobaculia bacterium]|nr:S8 family serine peptidase [Thermoanaerobaculia bacterium]